MYKCQDCGACFQMPTVSYETHGLDDPPFEQVNLCPRCGSIDVFPAVQCDLCWEYTSSPCVKTISGQFFCEDCYMIYDPTGF